MAHPATPSSRVSDLRSHAGFWLRFVSNHVSQAFARKLQASEITVAEWVVLREMYGKQEMTPGALATLMGMTKGAASKLTDRLVAKQLVTRQGRTDDRRYQDIQLTTAGRRLVPGLAALADQNDEEFFAPLTDRERDHLMSALKKLAAAHNFRKIPTE